MINALGKLQRSTRKRLAQMILGDMPFISNHHFDGETVTVLGDHATVTGCTFKNTRMGVEINARLGEFPSKQEWSKQEWSKWLTHGA